MNIHKQIVQSSLILWTYSGTRILPRGTTEDIASLQLEKRVFGIITSSDLSNRATVADALMSSKPSPLQMIENMKAERLYKSTQREALGRSVNRGMTLPSKFDDGNVTNIMYTYILPISYMIHTLNHIYTIWHHR